jgi:hypothetical protein
VVEEHAMSAPAPGSAETPVGMYWVVHVVPPSVVPTMANVLVVVVAMASHTAVDGHTSASTCWAMAG